MKNLLILIIMSFLTTNCISQKKENNVIPKQINTYIKKYLPDCKIVEERELVPDWKDFVYPEMEVICPTMLDYDFTNDGYKDFICMIIMNDGVGYAPYLVAFNNYETDNKLNHIIIEGVSWDGKFVNNIIYLSGNKKGFYVKKIESSLAFIHWQNRKYEVENEED